MKNNNRKQNKHSLYVSDENSFLENYLIIVKNNKMDFFIWIVISTIVALIGIWLPCLIHALMKTTENYQFKDVTVYTNIMKGSPYILYSITFLAETFLSTISIKRIVIKDTEKRNQKIILGIFVFLDIITMAVLLVISNILSLELNNVLQHICLVIAILLGLLLYPLRNNLFEATATSRNEEYDREMEELASTTKSKGDLLDD